MINRALRALLMWGALVFLFTGTAAVTLSQPQEQFRLDEIQKSIDRTTGYGERLVKLEDGVAQLQRDSEEARWWYRAIGGALILAVLERLLRTAGVLKDKSDGIGPVG